MTVLTRSNDQNTITWGERLIRLLLAASITLVAFAQAHAQDMASKLSVVVSPVSQIKDAEITLGVISRISNSYSEYEKLAEHLSAISLGEAPAPRTKKTIPGVKILEAIEKAGIPLDSIGYSIPQVVLIERLGHVIEADEVLNSVRESLVKDNTLDVQVREVSWNTDQVIPEGERRFEVEKIGGPQAGKIPLRLTAFVNEIPAARFLATAVVDDWREVPVMNKTLERGMLISPEDVEMVRLNLFKQPPDVADSLGGVIGRRTKQSLQAGETIKKSSIDIPPVIPKGKKIKMVFNNGALKATAVGVAVEDGFERSSIAVRNESSKKVVRARVVNANEVEVGVHE